MTVWNFTNFNPQQIVINYYIYIYIHIYMYYWLWWVVMNFKLSVMISMSLRKCCQNALLTLRVHYSAKCLRLRTRYTTEMSEAMSTLRRKNSWRQVCYTTKVDEVASQYKNGVSQCDRAFKCTFLLSVTVDRNVNRTHITSDHVVYIV